MASFTEYYPITDCENEGDINYAIKEVENAGGIFDKVINSKKYNADEIDDYYESQDWFIQFHCNSIEHLKITREKLGM